MMRNLCHFVLLAGICTTVHCQDRDVDSNSPLIVYKIQNGDTLNKLSRKYFRQPSDLETIKQINHLGNIDLLKSGAWLKIPRDTVKQSPSQATINSLSCARTIRAGTPLRPMAVGSVLTEGAIIDIPSECHASMLLDDGSAIRLPSSAAIKITILRRNALEKTPEVQLDLVRGKVDLEVFKGRAKTTPFEVRTPLSVTGVRGTEFRVGYTPQGETGQVEVLGGIVSAMGLNDTEAKAISKGQGMPFDSSGKSLPIEKLLPPPSFEAADLNSDAPSTYNIKLKATPEADHYIVTSAKTANLLSSHTSESISAPVVQTPKLSQQTVFFKFASVSKAGLMGATSQYGFCTAPNDSKSARCKATFDAPMSENSLITFALTRQSQGNSQELVSTKKLQSRNGEFTIEGLPSGRYSWNMSYATAHTATRQSGTFDLLTLSTTP